MKGGGGEVGAVEAEGTGEAKEKGGGGCGKETKKKYN